MFQRAVRVVSVVFTFALLAPAAAQALPTNLLVNGSFEDGPALGGAWDRDVLAGSTDIPGWVVFGTGSLGAIDYLGYPWDVSDGLHAIDLDGRDALSSGVQQAFATITGQRYDVAFDLSGNPGDSPANGLPRVKDVRVAVDGFTQDYTFDSTGQSVQDLDWDPISFWFIASGSSATLSFTSLTGYANSYGALIDNVRVYSAPEMTSTAPLLLAGLATLALCAKFTKTTPAG